MSPSSEHEMSVEHRQTADRLQALLAERPLETPDDLRIDVPKLVGASRRRRRRIGSVALATVVLAAVAALAVSLHSAKRPRPDLAEAARIALLAPQERAPETSHTRPGELSMSSGRLVFPDWTADGWRATGSRSEERGGERLKVVTYENSRARQVGYLISAGAPLSQAPGREGAYGSGAYRVMRIGNIHAVTWREDGQTCVLSSTDTPVSTLLRLASIDS